MAKYGPCTKALLSTMHNSLVCLLAVWFMAMKSWQWEERKSLAKFLSYSLQMAWKEGLVSSWYLPNKSEMISWGGWVYSQISICVEIAPPQPFHPDRMVMCENYIVSQELKISATLWSRLGENCLSKKNVILQNGREAVVNILPPLCSSPQWDLSTNPAVRGISLISAMLLKHKALRSLSKFSGLAEWDTG